MKDQLANLLGRLPHTLRCSGRRVRRGRSSFFHRRLEALECRALLTAGLFDPTFWAPEQAPDPTWPGEVATSFGGGDAALLTDVAVQSDGKIVAVGYGTAGGTNVNFLTSRYNSDGSLDEGFSFDGKVNLDLDDGSPDRAAAVTVQDDGKILVAGSSDVNFALARILVNGEPDPDFGDGGLVLDAGSGSGRWYDVAVQENGTIAVVGGGRSDTISDVPIAALYRQSDGSQIDFKEFSDLEIPFAAVEFIDLEVRDNGRMFAVTSLDSLVELNSNLEIYEPFAVDGVLPLLPGSANAIALDSDERILVAGSTTVDGESVASVRRFHSDGTPDGSFAGGVFALGVDGSRFTDVTVDSQGRIVASGLAAGIGVVVRLRADGSPDPEFGSDGFIGGVTRIGIDSLAIAPDGKIVVGGEQPAVGVDGDSPNDFWLFRMYGKDPEFDLVRVTDVGDTLGVVGGNNSESVELVDFGNGFVLVRSPRENVDGVFEADTIVVDMNGGHDNVSYSAVHVPTQPWLGLSDVQINTGSGDDRTTIDADIQVPSFVEEESWTLSIDAGKGKDLIDLAIKNLTNVAANLQSQLGRGDDRFTSRIVGTIGDGATARISVEGQGGSDAIGFEAATENAEIVAPLQIDAAGGAGADKLVYRGKKARRRDAEVAGFGNVELNLRGDDGSDRISVDAAHDVAVVADGGSGGDDVELRAIGDLRDFQAKVELGPTGRSPDHFTLKFEDLPRHFKTASSLSARGGSFGFDYHVNDSVVATIDAVGMHGADQFELAVNAENGSRPFVTVRSELNDGSDTSTMDFTGDFHELNLTSNLGSGHDTADIRLLNIGPGFGGSLQPTDVLVDIDAGAGSDRVGVRFTDTRQSDLQHVPEQINADLRATMQQGRDQLRVASANATFGGYKFVGDMGRGADAVFESHQGSRFYPPDPFSPDDIPTDAYVRQLMTGAQADTVNSVWRGVHVDGSVNSQIETGGGNDFVRTIHDRTIVEDDNTHKLGTGEGSDTIISRRTRVADGSLHEIIDAGSQPDRVIAHYLHGEPAGIGVGGDVEITYEIVGGPGRDDISGRFNPDGVQGLTVGIDGGGGNDNLEVSVSDGTVDNSHITIFGGAGRDTIGLTQVDLTILKGGSLLVDAGDGRDEIDVTLRGTRLNGLYTVLVDAGDDDDVVSVVVDFLLGSPGNFDGLVLGGSGNDRVTFELYANGVTVLDAILDGGDDLDTCMTVGPITVLNCEL